jgi:menaquinone-dependent protoporphyrinogen oxidase
MKVLVAYGSKRGGTRGIAETLARALTEAGDDVDVRDAREVRSIDGYEMVVVGGALYANRWHKSARRLVKRNAAALERVPVWLFSSGPLDDSARTGEIPPVGQVSELIDLVGARGHQTFGGRLSPDAKGFPASAMARDRTGDWRDTGQIADWARQMHAEIAQTG